MLLQVLSDSLCDVFAWYSYRSELTARFEEIMQNLKRTQKSLNDSVMFLPDFEVKSAQNILQKMQSDISQKHDELLPRKKFGFKSRTKVVAKAENNIESLTKRSSEESEKDSKEEGRDKVYIGGNDFGFSNRSDCELSMSSEESKGKDIKLSNLENCTVKIYGCPSALHITGIKNCKIVSGPISRASFISDSASTHFSLACQQVRIHTTKDCIFNIHVTGKAIIEDCSNLGFAPYNWSYQNLSSDFQEAGLKLDINKWDDIDDFNWLTSSEPSPNWYKVPEDSRLVLEESC